MRRVSGQKLTTTETLLAAICDRLSLLVWLNTKDAQKGRNRPESILSGLNNKEKEKPIAYKDGAAFMAARNAILGGVADGD